jgi:DNA-binding HxlR family transcriptional regulator
MVITKRDLLLFRTLASYGMLSTKQVASNVFHSIATTTVLRRLRTLEASNYLRRITGLESQEVLWVLMEKGAEIAGVQLSKRHWSKNMLNHDHKLLSLRLKLEKCGVAKSWIPEHEIRSLIFKKYGLKDAKQKLIPDGLMGVEAKGNKTSVAIELELTLKNQGRIKEIVKRYQEKKDLSAVWYIAESKTILNSLFREWINHQGPNKSIKLHGSLFEDVIKNPAEALIYGEGNSLKVKDVWCARPAHSSAQGVSTLYSLSMEQKTRTTQENHLNKIEIPFPKSALSITDLPPPTCCR